MLCLTPLKATLLMGILTYRFLMVVLRYKVLRIHFNLLLVFEHKCNTLFPIDYQSSTLSQESRLGEF